MDFTKEEILHSLDVIHSICYHTDDCFDCPFYKEGVGCVISEMSPIEWDMVSPDAHEIWRAFENY